MKKWLVGFACVGMLAVTAMGQATLPTTWSGPWTNANLPTGWTNTGLGVDYSGTTGGYDSTGGGPARFDGAGDMLTINFDSAPGDVTYWPRLNVGSGTWTTNIFTLQESANGTDWSDVTVYNAGNPIPTTAPTGPYTSTPSATARYLRFVYTQKGNGNVGIDGVTIPAGSGVVATNVKFSASSVAVDEDQGIYEVTVLKTVASGDASGQIALSGTATYGVGADYTVDTTNFTLNGATTSAVVTVTINDDADSETAETVVMDLANVTGAGTTAPTTFTLTINASDQTAYGIAIVTNAPENGTVTTTPASEAIAGATVTITATPAGGYRVASIAVVDESMTPVAVTGNTFTMPASAVTVTVTFETYVAPDVLIDFETVTGFSGYAAGTSTVSGVSIRHLQALRGTTAGSDRFNGAASARVRYLATNIGFMATANAFAQPITKINFFYANYGSDTTGKFKVQVSPDGAAWTDVGAAEYDPDSTTLTEATIDTIPENMTYVQFLMTTGASQRVSIDDIGLWFGAAIFGVTFDKTTGFVVPAGSSDAITATAANGVEPYTYEWSSSLVESSASSNVFTILATATNGAYWAQVVAIDNSAARVTNTINFSVVTPHAITIVTNDPSYGTVTTTPAAEAIEGTAVTVTATPAGGYAVGSITVNGGAVPVVGNAFTMPASDATVTVTFILDIATLPILESYTAATDWTTLPGWSGVSMGSYSDGDAQFNDTNDSLTVNFDSQPGELTFTLHGRSSTAGAAPMQFLVEESANGADWTQVASLGDGSVTTSVTTNGPYSLAAASRYVRWTLANKYLFNVGLNDVSITSGGPAVFGVSLNRTNGFTVNEGSSDTILATAANGTPPYTYGWSSTLNGTYFTADTNRFTILATAPTGSYSATVTATDATSATVTNTVAFSVVWVNPDAPAVVISGPLSGTTNVQMNLTITVTNETATDWFITLKDPDGLDDTSYGWTPPAFTLTPTKTGTYTLTAEAVTGSGNYSNTVQLTVSGAAANPPIGPITFVAGTGFRFAVPDGYTLLRVEGANTVVGANQFTWTTLSSPTDYTVSGTTVTILRSAASSRLVRIWLSTP